MGIGFHQIDMTVATYAELLQQTGMPDGTVVFVRDTDKKYMWDLPTSSWRQENTGWKTPVADMTELNAIVDKRLHDIVYVASVDTTYRWTGTSWSPLFQSINAAGFEFGCTLRWVSTTGVAINPGILSVYTVLLNIPTLISVGWGNLEAGSTQKSSTWYYVYLLNNSGSPSVFVSELHPTRDTNSATIKPYEDSTKYHPSRPARLVGQFLTDATGLIVKFSEGSAGLVYYEENVTSILNEVNTNAITLAKDVMSLVPKTSSEIVAVAQMRSGLSLRYVGTELVWKITGGTGFCELRLPLSRDNLTGGTVTGVVTSSTNNVSTQDGTKAFDGNVTTAWRCNATNPGTRYLEFTTTQLYDAKAIKFVPYSTTVTSFRVLGRLLATDAWTVMYTGTTINAEVQLSQTYTFKYFRIELVTFTTTTPGITEFSMYSESPTCIYYRCDGSVDKITLNISGYYFKR